MQDDWKYFLSRLNKFIWKYINLKSVYISSWKIWVITLHGHCGSKKIRQVFLLKFKQDDKNRKRKQDDKNRKRPVILTI